MLWAAIGCACAAAWSAPAVPRAAAQESKWVTTGATGRLIYVPDAEGDRIPDFSMVGYGAGRRAIPTDVPVVIRIDPIAGDNTAHIQNAINFAAGRPLGANGFRGVVELGPGKYNVDGHLSITTSGIVLRGAGAGNDLATNTHLVSQNRTDAFSSPSTPVINIQGSSSGTTRGSQIQIVDKVVPVGAQSFRVASTTGLAVGGMVEIYRPSTQAWIETLGMDQMPGDAAWEAGDQQLRWHRTITRIEGNRVFVDAPITTALDAQFGGGTVRTYNSPNRIRNVGVENLRGQSLDLREEANETRTPTFVRFTRVDDGWVSDVETRHFPYASVFTSEADGTQHITVDNVSSRLPSGAVTGGRRYSFAMDAQLSLVQNSFADSGRHDFVTGSAVTGPIVFYNSSSANTRADSGPHHRWGNGLLFDNIDVNGHAINVQNRWTSGSGHGWAGANVVIWNSEANSFIVQNPPTAQSWLVGSTGTINPGNDHLPDYDGTGYYDSHGARVITGGKQSLYEAQLADAADMRVFHWRGGPGSWSDPTAWEQNLTPGVYRVAMRDYLHGDIDKFVLDAGTVDAPSVDGAWSSAIAAQSPAPIVGFDRSTAQQNAAFTFLNQLDPGERVIHASLALSLKQVGGDVANDFLQLVDMDPSRRLAFSSLGWASQVDVASPFVGVVDLGPYLERLQTGALNAWVSDNTAVDWAMYAAAVATPVSDLHGATVFVDGGGVRVEPGITTVDTLTLGGRAASELSLSPGARLGLNGRFRQAGNASLAFELSGPLESQIGRLFSRDQAQLDGTASIRLLGGYMPEVGTTFDVLGALGGLNGTTFDEHVSVDDATGLVWGWIYRSTGVSAQLLTIRHGDLDHDGLINAADWAQFVAGAGVDFSELMPADAYTHGDLNNDGVHDLYDFSTFVREFDEANGPGAFLRMTSGVPEPETGTLALMAVAAWIRASTYHRRAANAEWDAPFSFH